MKKLTIRNLKHYNFTTSIFYYYFGGEKLISGKLTYTSSAINVLLIYEKN